MIAALPLPTEKASKYDADWPILKAPIKTLKKT